MPESSSDSTRSPYGNSSKDDGPVVLAERSNSDHGRGPHDHDEEPEDGDARLPYRTYKRRFFGLAQLVLLNIVVSWDWLTFAAVSNLTAEYFRVSESAVNWLSTAFLFAFLVASPATIWVLSKRGPRDAIAIASILVLVGNWIRYGGSRATPGNFGLVMFGQILIGLSQSFVLASPSFYANVWFSDRGRVSAIAVASLANPLGGALGQLIGPLWATDASGIPSMILYTAIISSVATIPTLFLPKKPPTPPSAVAAAETLDLSQALRELPRNGSFWLILIPFSVYVGFFNAFSSLINQIFQPYRYSEEDAGIAGALLIFVGLGASAVISPIIDRTKAYMLTIKILVPVIAICYTILIFMPETYSLVGPYIICALLGATSFSLLPCALELLAVVTHPISPEVSSTIAWAGGQLLGGIFIIIMTALASKDGWDGQPPGTLKRSLIFEAVVSWAAVPFPLLLGIGKFKQARTLLPSMATHGIP